MNMRGITFVITCKGRLHHLQQTLPLLVDMFPQKIVVVDYGCPDSAGQWVAEHFPNVCVVYVNDDSGFCAARARNIGARHVDTEWIFFIDADVQVQPGWCEWLMCNLDSKFYYRISNDGDSVRNRGLWGTFICYRKAFQKINGYDEVFRDWGSEDDDIYARLQLISVKEAYYPENLVKVIAHTDQERLRFSTMPTKDISHCVNKFYMDAKLLMMAARSKRLQPPLSVRLNLMTDVKASMADWIEGKAQNLPVFNMIISDVAWLPSPFRMKKNISVTFAVEQQEDSPLYGNNNEYKEQ